MKRFLIIASMICLLVSSLVVVSFADNTNEPTDEQKDIYQYNYHWNVNFNVKEGTVYSDFQDPYGVGTAYCGRALVGVYGWNGETMYFYFDNLMYGYSEQVLTDGTKIVDYYLGDDISLLRFEFNTLGSDVLTGTRMFYQSYIMGEYGGSSDYVCGFHVYCMDKPVVRTGDLSEVVSVSYNVVEDPHSPSYLISLLFTGFGTAIGGLALGIKESLSNVIWVDPSATERTLSPLVIFIFTIAGLGIGMTVFYMVFRLIRFGRQR